MPRKRKLGLKWQKLAIYRAWPWISNSDFQAEPELGTFGSRVQRFFRSPFFNPLWLHQPTEQSHCGFCLLLLNQSVLADFDDRKKKKLPDLRLVAFQARVINAALEWAPHLWCGAYSNNLLKKLVQWYPRFRKPKTITKLFISNSARRGHLVTLVATFTYVSTPARNDRCEELGGGEETS